jgi:hypothetical protein
MSPLGIGIEEATGARIKTKNKIKISKSQLLLVLL